VTTVIGIEFRCFCRSSESVTLLFWGVGPEYTVFSGRLLIERMCLWRYERWRVVVVRSMVLRNDIVVMQRERERDRERGSKTQLVSMYFTFNFAMIRWFMSIWLLLPQSVVCFGFVITLGCFGFGHRFPIYLWIIS
jgi:hypothetical protein